MNEKRLLKDNLYQENFPYHFQISDLSTDYGLHSHDFSELVIILEGSALHITDIESYPITKGDVFVIHEGITHGFTNVQGLKLCNIMYDSKILARQNNYLNKMKGYQALFVFEPYYRKEHHFKSKLQLKTHALFEIEDILLNMSAEYTRREDGFEAAFYAYFILLVSNISRAYTSFENSATKNIFTFAQAISFIENNYLNQISIRELSDMTFLSERQFSRVFKQTYKISPIQYIINLRIKFACILLAKSNMNITEIAFESGFSDVDYFSRLFKNKKQITPKKYREIHIV